MGFELNGTDRSKSVYDITSYGYKFLQFSYKTSNIEVSELQVQVVLNGTLSAAYGGECNPAQGKCDNHFSAGLAPVANWTTAKVSLEVPPTSATAGMLPLAQGAWGAVVPYNQTTFLAIQFNVTVAGSTSKTFKVWVDDVRFGS
jgi:hypothetical protein